MPIPAAANILLTFYGRCFGQRVMLTHTYEKVSGAVGALTVKQELEEFIDAISVGSPGDMITPYLACLPPQYSMEEVRAQVIAPIGFRSSYNARAVVSPGTHASPATVANDSACITMRTDQAGRNQVSNKHIGPAPDAISAAGLLTAGYITTLSGLADVLLATLTNAVLDVYQPCITHDRITGTSTPITGYRIGLQSRVQRRRTVGLGE